MQRRSGGDSRGHGIDEGIQDVVVSFNVMEIPTSASCEGHVDSGVPHPWVRVEADGKPEEQFEQEREVAERIAQERGVEIEQILRSRDYEGWMRWREERKKYPETTAYQEWRKKQLELVQRIEELLRQFNLSRNPNEDVRLQCDDGPEAAHIENGGESDIPFFRLKEATEEIMEKRKERLVILQKEMRDFGEFLKQRYFEE